VPTGEERSIPTFAVEDEEEESRGIGALKHDVRRGNRSVTGRRRYRAFFFKLFVERGLESKALFPRKD